MTKTILNWNWSLVAIAANSKRKYTLRTKIGLKKRAYIEVRSAYIQQKLGMWGNHVT